MKKTTYVKEAPNAKALTQVSNWLKAANIGVERSAVEGCDLVVKRAEGGEMQVKVGISESDARPVADHMFVLAGQVAHRNKPIALAAFHSITEAAGHGKPLPINRGVDPVKKLSFEDNFELVAMRHKEFRKVPNPDPVELAAYDKVIMKAVGRIMFINLKICRRHGLEISDLKTYAQVWTCNYLGLYKVANPTNHDNERKLYAHLCQRFSGFIEVLLKKERNCIPDPQTTCVAILGKPYEPAMTTRRAWQQEVDASIDEAIEMELEEEVGLEAEFNAAGEPMEFVDDSEEAIEISEAKRRKIAQAALKEQLDKLSHEEFMFLLTEAAENGALCYDARAEAKKQLRLHRAKCMSCAAASTEAQEEAAGSEALG